MLTTEFNLEEAKKIWQEEAFEDGVATGEVRKDMEYAKKLLDFGLTPEQVAKMTGLPIDKIMELTSD